jgi:hypothetical protein
VLLKTTRKINRFGWCGGKKVRSKLKEEKTKKRYILFVVGAQGKLMIGREQCGCVGK